jgi:U32 family peptidase
MVVPSPHVVIDCNRPLLCPELLAPAGDWECARAAVENGADAIYFGLERFNARMRAHNFTEADLPKLVEFLHSRGVKGYVTFNTLVFSDELADAQDYLRAIIAAGVDAAIVQDVGICRLIRHLSPDFPIHASTQMTITSAAGVEFARELGCNLVVLARECSIAEIEKIRGPARAALPLEVFVHGALCVAYSGQCLTSEALGGRSANRGECAQACRMPYELISDGRRVDLGDRQYLLSPQDLAGLPVLADLIRAGVASLKIEGRLKSPEYVANITRVYREALDKAFAEISAGHATGATEVVEQLNHSSRYNLEMAFSRGLYTGWLAGINNQQLVHGRFGKKRGVYLGEVIAVRNNWVAAKLVAPLKPGDGVVFDAGHPEAREEGGRVYTLDTHGTETLIGFGRGKLDFRRIEPGHKIWKTSDPELDRNLRQSFSSESPNYKRPLRMEAHGCVGSPLTLIVRDDAGHVVQVQSRMPLAKAETRPLTPELLEEQLGRLGATAFQLAGVVNHIEAGLILPISELNRLRRDAIAQLDVLRRQPRRWVVNGADELNRLNKLNRLNESSGSVSPESDLIVLCRTFEQLRAALDCGVRTLYCELENPKRYREAVAIVREARTGSAIFVAPPRIFKTGEEWILKQVRSSEPDGFLARNYDHLSAFSGTRLVGDFSLNVANELAAEYFLERFGLEHVTASYDLNISQLEALLRAAPDWFEVTIHQHMPMFHMEHCVFCAFLSDGTDYRNCGRPCDKHQVRLRDRVGAQHVLKADAGCRNTVFNALAQTGAEHVARLQSFGLRRFRIEFVDEPPAQVALTIAKYRDLLEHRISGAQLWRELKLLNQLGVTRGQMGKSSKLQAPSSK